ncbi:MAG: NAD(P)/FAD-dependent oxidoreductase [Candidatus Neomarinimicrobiota bacterium]|jgi:glycerol-3-phosphate dehydrogenase|nr:NAD(P)/FAD-dependent oxidoreductase [Candidatus Neomarinimicrobiota bacterium]MDD3966036.1 NAD(P)/FAD-dependent oxidoreductase [Candidatus Neomarinimicrobiota bacterium]MDX9779921.1 NAD(P)/FAD-dependent oxidoreductase [bacterium]
MKADIVIIGAGIIGCAIANTLAKYDLSVLVIEKNNDVSGGASKANSGIVHAGYDAEPGTLMAEFNISGKRMYPALCERLDVPFRKTGSLVLAFSDAEMRTLEALKNRGEVNGVQGLEILDAGTVRKRETHVNPGVKGALYAPDAGIVSPYELCIALMENAMDNGVSLWLDSPVANIRRSGTAYVVQTPGKSVETAGIVNCAGAYADRIHAMLLPETFKIHPRRGEYFLLDKYAAAEIGHVLFQCPTELGKGVLIAPTVHGNVIVGPNAHDVSDPEALETTAAGLKEVWETALRSIPDLPYNQVITTFSGVRAEPSSGDFIVRDYPGMPGFIDVAGIKSPGLTAAPAIALYVENIIKTQRGGLSLRSDFRERRRELPHFHGLSHDARRELVKKDPRFGRIICRCESVTEAEIVDAIHRNAGARTLDGVKRRTRCGGGRCQGGFCGPRIIEILSRELGIPREKVRKDNAGSEILVESAVQENKHGAV